MTLTLELTEEEEVLLREKASRAGTDESGYLRLLISGSPTEPSHLTDDEWNRLLDEVGSELDPSTPLLSDEAVSRASFYEDRV